MPKVKKSRKAALPRRLLAIRNADKQFHEKWEPGRDPLNFPHPFRGIVIGPPNTGKSTAVKNIVIRADPPFERVVIIHADHKGTEEYDDLGSHGVTLTSDIPDPSGWEGDKKTLAVIDDIDLKGLKKQQKTALDRLFGYVSTHKNTSVLSCGQDYFSQPPVIRRCANLTVLWASPDKSNMTTIAKRLGVPDLLWLMRRSCPQFHDSLWFDSTRGSPYPLRKNGFEIMEHANPVEEDVQDSNDESE